MEDMHETWQAGDLPWDTQVQSEEGKKGVFLRTELFFPSSPGRSRATRHGWTHWCCRIRGTDAWELVEPGAAKGFPSASPLPTQTKAKGFIAP